MKIKALNFWTKLISLCLVLLGFNACGEGDGNDPVDEYGTPSAEYKLMGKIVSEENQEKGIKGIQVTMNDIKYPREENKNVKTDEKGYFTLQQEDFPRNKHVVNIEDIDGELNGSFEDKKIEIEFTDEDYEGGSGSWYKGAATKDLGVIKLTPKAEKNENE